MTYQLPANDATRVTFAWADSTGDHTAEHTFIGALGEKSWTVPTGKNVRTKWVEFAPAATFTLPLALTATCVLTATFSFGPDQLMLLVAG